MILNWKYNESTVRPAAIDTTSSPTTVYLNRNIHEVQRTIDEKTITMWEYETAKLSNEEFQSFLIEKERSDIDYIAMMTDVDLEEV